MSTEVGPQPKLGQRFEIIAEVDKVVESRSAPSGTSPRTKFPPLYQRIEANRQRGPTSVLIHKSHQTPDGDGRSHELEYFNGGC